MKRAALAACLFAIAAPALAQTPISTAGPITNQAERDVTAERVRGGASCAGCDLFQINLAYSDLAGRDFSGSRIRQADLTVVTADRADFHGSNLSLTNFFGARLTGADLRNTNLEGANLVGAYLGGARMDGAALDGANIAGAEMETAHGLTQDQLNTACGDATTRLPAGLSVRTC
jgi:uncharacterized protein YjbI with pentapeptide repeats